MIHAACCPLYSCAAFVANKLRSFDLPAGRNTRKVLHFYRWLTNVNADVEVLLNVDSCSQWTVACGPSVCALNTNVRDDEDLYILGRAKEYVFTLNSEYLGVKD